MSKVQFKPGFTVINYEYDNPSSGGQSIVIPGDPNHSYYDPETGRIYMHLDDGFEGAGWYYLSGDSFVYYGPDLNVDGMIEQ